MPAKGQYKSTATKRSKQQRKYNSTKKAKEDRAKRNKVRRQANASGRTRKGDGKDIDHKKPLRSGGSNSKKNTRVVSKSANRARNGSRPGVGGKKKR
jgi:hypothetical protein